jgi:hypothetical protein
MVIAQKASQEKTRYQRSGSRDPDIAEPLEHIERETEAGRHPLPLHRGHR